MYVLVVFTLYIMFYYDVIVEDQCPVRNETNVEILCIYIMYIYIYLYLSIFIILIKCIIFI